MTYVASALFSFFFWPCDYVPDISYALFWISYNSFSLILFQYNVFLTCFSVEFIISSFISRLLLNPSNDFNFRYSFSVLKCPVVSFYKFQNSFEILHLFHLLCLFLLFFEHISHSNILNSCLTPITKLLLYISFVFYFP